MKRLISILTSFSLFALSLPTSAFAEAENSLWSKPTYEKQVYKIGQKLLQSNSIEQKITFGIEYGKGYDKVNASANGDYSRVILEEGLLQYIESDDELAGILGHEIAHILCKHSAKLTETNIPSNLEVSEDTSPSSGSIVAATALLGVAGLPLLFLASRKKKSQAIQKTKQLEQSLSFSQRQELEADTLAIELMVKAGFNPVSMENIMNKVAGDGAKKYRTHPTGTERINNIRAVIQTKFPQQINPDSPSDQSNATNSSIE